MPDDDFGGTTYNNKQIQHKTLVVVLDYYMHGKLEHMLW